MVIITLLSALVGVSAFLYSGPVSADILNIVSLLAMGLIIIALAKGIIKRDPLSLICLSGSLLYLAGTAGEIIITIAPVAPTPFTLHAQLYGALAQVLFLGFGSGSENTPYTKKI